MNSTNENSHQHMAPPENDNTQTLAMRVPVGAQYLIILQQRLPHADKAYILKELSSLSIRILRHCAQQSCQFITVLARHPLSRQDVLQEAKLLHFLANHPVKASRLLTNRQIFSGSQLSCAARKLTRLG